MTCDVSQTYDQNAIATASHLSSDLPYVICVKLTDAAGNITYGKSRVVTRDISIPTVNVGSDLTVNAQTNIDATTSGATVFVWTQISGSGTITFGSANAEDTTVSADTDDTYVVRLTVTDAAGNSAFDELNVVWDTSAPTFTSLVKTGDASDGYVNDAEKNNATALWVLTASNYNTVNYTAPLDDTTPVTCDVSKTYGASTIATAADLPNSDKPYVICVELADTAGNITYGKSQVVERDTTLPTVNAGSDVIVNATYNSDATVNGATTYQWSQESGPGIITFGSATSKDSTVAADTDGLYVIRLTATDAAGNSNHDELNFTWATTGPIVSSFVGANEATDGYLNAAEVASTSVLLQLTASNYTSADYTNVLSNTGLTCDANQTYGNNSIPQIDTVPATDGTYAVCVDLFDGVNHAYAKSQLIVRDTAAPTVNVGGDVIANASHNINATSSDAVTFAWSKQSGTGTITFGSANAEDTTVTSDTEGAFVLRLTVTDVAGNSAFDELNFTWDVSGPTFTSLVETGDAADGYVNDAEKSGNTALWALTASDYDAVDYTVALDNTISVTCDSNQTYNQSAIARATDLPSSDKPYVICVKLSDTAGNTTYGKSAVVTRDVDYSVFTSLVGANEASDGYVNDAEKASASALLTLSASGQSSAKYTVVLADSSLTCDGSKTYSESSIPAINTIPGADGAYAVCVELKDVAGNITYGKSDQIVRDTNLPTVNAGSDLTANDTVNIDATTSSAVTYAWTQISGSGTVTFGTPSAEDTNFSANADDTYVVRLTVTDVAGNSAFDEVSITWDQTPPVFTSLVKTGDAADGYVNDAEKNGNTALWALTSSGHTAVDYTVPLDDSTPVTCDVSKTYNQAGIATAADLSSDLPYVICVKLEDAAGNITYGKSQIVTRDISIPTVNVGSDRTVNAQANIDATSSGATVFTWTKVSGSGNITFGSANAEDTTVSADADDTYVLRLTVADAAGNTAQDELNFTWDTGSPTFTSLVGTGDAADGYVNDAEKSGNTALWALTASDYDAVDYTVALDNTVSVTCDSNQTYNQSAIARATDLPSSDKPYVICVKLSDTAGNEGRPILRVV